MILLISTTVVNLGNYLYNLLMGRWLGPAAFADVSLLVTLFLVVTLVTATLQTVAARYSAIYQAGGQVNALGGLRAWGARRAWLIGLGCAALMAGGAPFWQQFFHTQSPWPFVILGVGVPVYFAQGVDRGILQGAMRFGVLALSYQAEMWARLLLGIVLVAAGWAVNGAIAALTLSFVATWLVARSVRRSLPAGMRLGDDQVRAAVLYAGPVAVASLGQILINNSDVLLVKHYFAPADAGQYAALALIGRIVFFATWSVVMVLLPSVAQREEQGLPHRHLLWLSLGLVGAASVAVVGACFWGGEWVLQILFGEQYLGVAPLLWLYALATTLFALANVFITYDLSLGRRSGSWLALVAGCVQIGAVMTWHESLAQVVAVQIAVMLLLVVVLGVHAWWENARR
jgi:O-antigen/teichoic acid export membrane protein